ncbi:hypothetical protein ACQPZQ_33780 [Pseudonocardia sp. CA-142604]|uniref:hypothetical protein n=1 Tax=Pseudonocardia sp. CA-142604 TaxID=3240024 RepID=UPI003D8A6C48
MTTAPTVVGRADGTDRPGDLVAAAREPQPLSAVSRRLVDEMSGPARSKARRPGRMAERRHFDSAHG